MLQQISLHTPPSALVRVVILRLIPRLELLGYEADIFKNVILLFD